MAQELNPKQKAFVREYCVDLNATQAAIRAGYKPIGAHVTASRLLSDPKIAAAVEQSQAKVAEKTNVTIEQIVKGLRDLAFPEAGPASVFPRDRLKAMELLARHLGMFTEKREISGPGGGPIEVKAKTWVDLMNEEA